jgi:two-component system, NtrC family, response regulator AtoC
MARILVVDNEERMCKVVQAGLTLEKHQVDIALSGRQALSLMTGSVYDIVLTDLKMNEIDGMQLLKEIKANYPAAEVILMTAFASQQTAVEAMRLGAYDYLIKPFGIDELLLRIGRISDQLRLKAENIRLRRSAEVAEPVNMIGKSSKMRTIYQLIGKVAETDATVLIRGESGTGKELVAEAVHQKSHRAAGPFVVVNCAAVPENLLESELFGYEKGAFTGAIQRKTGLFETADKGTLFLDEIGDMPVGLQAKLLRVLQSREVIRVGGIGKIRIDVRVIAATNLNLESRIESGQFRSDLYYRLNIFPIQLPPLRERKEDIPGLIQHFMNSTGKGISPAARKILIEYDWPGNVRELFNVLERAAIVADSIIEPVHLPRQNVPVIPPAQNFIIPDEGVRLDEIEARLLQAAIEKAGGNKTRAAHLLGITRRRLYSLMEKHAIGN